MGNGNYSAADRALLKYAKESGIQIVRSSRTGSGKVTETSGDAEYNLLPADNLNPQKARILLMLLLMQSRQLNDLKRNFQLY